VVLSFSFTNKELRADPWARLRDSLEQLDIKYSAEYEASTTHVVSKKRNTSKGLQALINGRYIVTDSFINAIVDAATVPADAEEGTSSALEQDFEAAWPNPTEHLPPRGEEPIDRPPEAYAPDERRREVFDGCTFVFYERKQYENLLPAITTGKGKAQLMEVTPGVTDVDEFIRFVKGLAGEKGLGSFEDGSEGKGVVVVRYTPKDENQEWFAQFLTAFAQRLDHRPIDQREFLEAILACDASMLRRPLESATETAAEPEPEPVIQHAHDQGDRMEVDQPPAESETPQEPTKEQDSAPAPPRPRARRAGRTRFKGFDFDDTEFMEQTPPIEASEPPQVAAASQDSLFVSQYQEPNLAADEEAPGPRPSQRSQHKRALSPLPEYDNSALMEEIAPRAAAAKRRRIESGETPEPPPPAPELEPQPEEDEEMATESPQGKRKKGQAAKGKAKKAKEGEDILELARQRREEAEAKAAAERLELQATEDGIDYAAIRALHIVEECEVHLPEERGGTSRTREQDIADGRWDPRWNGRKNFKRFRKHGEGPARPAARIIIGLEEVKPKEYGIGDDYWLEDEGSSRRKKDSQRGESQSQQQQQSREREPSQGGLSDGGTAKDKGKQKPAALRRTVLVVDSSDEDEGRSEVGTVQEDSVIPDSEPSRSRAAKNAERANARRGQSQTQTQTQSQVSTRASGKRSAPLGAATVERAAKRPRKGFMAAPSDDDESEDSDDELKFRFGRRR
jgi:DNA repair protein XRS2